MQSWPVMLVVGRTTMTAGRAWRKTLPRLGKLSPGRSSAAGVFSLWVVVRLSLTSQRLRDLIGSSKQRLNSGAVACH
jgi:hypothetical protein